MGRGKLRMQLITNEKSRYKYLAKRKKSLEKSAKDLSTLCGIDVGMIVYSPAVQDIHSDQPITIWPPENQQVLSGLIDSYKGRSCHDCGIKTFTLSDFFKDKTKKVEDELKMKQLHGGLMAKIDAVRRRINLMKGSTSLMSCNNSVDQESCVFGPNMWKYDGRLPNFVYASGSGSGSDQMTMMSYGGGASKGMYGFDENMLHSYHYAQPMRSYISNVQNVETWPGSYNLVPLPTQMPMGIECLSSNTNAGDEGDDQRLSPTEWFLNEES